MVEPVRLICIPSHHDDSLYTWEVVGSQGQKQSFPSSPVVYVSRPGIFRCEVVNASKGKATSQMMEVRLDPGLFKLLVLLILYLYNFGYWTIR